MLRILLEAHGYEVDDARNGAEAIDKARKAPPDLIISDLLMPVMDGYTLLRTWNTDERLKHIPFVVYTATYVNSGDEKLAHDLGAARFIVKPTEPQAFISQIREVVEAEKRGEPGPTNGRAIDEAVVLKEYSEALVRKLEEKAAQLEAVNRDLADREARLRAIFETEPECVKLIAPDGSLLEMNPAGLRMIEADSLEQVRGRRMYEIVTKEYRKPFRELTQEVFRGGSGILEFEIVGLRGTRRRLETHASALRDATGQVSALLGITRDVTERRHADVQLRESEARVRLSVEAANIGLWDWNLVTNEVDYSPEWKSQIGYREDEISNSFSEWESRVHPEDLEPTLKKTNAYLADPRGRHEVEFRFRHKNGTYRWIYAHGRVVVGTEGKPDRMLGCHIDITQRKQSEEALKKSEERFSAVFKAAPGSMMLFSLPGGHTVEVNDRFTEITGYTREEAIGKTTAELGMWADPTARERFLTMLERDGAVASFEADLRHRSGAIRNGLISGEILTIGNESYLLGVFFDITQLKTAELAKRASEEQYRDLVDHMRDLVCRHDAQGNLLFVNRASAELLGYPPGELVGKNLREILEPGTERPYARYLKTILSKGEASGLMLVRTRSGESRVWEYHNTLRTDGPSIFTVRGLAHDITERQRAEAKLKESRDRLRDLSARLDSAREEEGKRIAREIHDELGGALTALKWDIEGIDKAVSRVANGHELLSVRDKLPAVSGLIDSTIETVRRIAAELRPPVLDDLGLAAAIESQTVQFEQRTGIRCTFASNTTAARLSRERTTAVFRIFQEIMTNVIRHSRAKRVTIKLTERQGWLELRVKDNGRGITDEEKNNTRALGLLGMNERALLVGGEISISGEPGKGTTAVVRVPAGD